MTFLGPFAPFVLGTFSVVVALALVEMGVLLIRLGGRAVSGESVDA